MNRYSQHFQVKRLLGFVISANGTPWMVLETGDARVWLFSQGYSEGYNGNCGCFVATGLQNPVKKSRLVDTVRRALQSGMNVDMRQDPSLIYTERMQLTHTEVQGKVAIKKQTQPKPEIRKGTRPPVERF